MSDDGQVGSDGSGTDFPLSLASPLSPEGQEGHPGQERGVHTESLVVGEGIVEEQTDFHLGAGSKWVAPAARTRAAWGEG